METGRVVHCKADACDIRIDRRTGWGNPFLIGKDGNREEVLQKYESWLRGTGFKGFRPVQRRYILTHLEELRGKVLGCWCAPNRCHGDILHELLDEGGI